MGSDGRAVLRSTGAGARERAHVPSSSEYPKRAEEEMTKGEGPLIGIDHGTTYSYVGVSQQVEIMSNDQGNRTTPSYVAFTETKRLIGDAAKNQLVMNPTNTIFSTCIYLEFIQCAQSLFYSHAQVRHG